MFYLSLMDNFFANANIFDSLDKIKDKDIRKFIEDI